MTELPVHAQLLGPGPLESGPSEAEAPEPDGSVAHPVPIDSPTTRDGDGGTPADTLPPPLGT
ncbi:hypothetical protein [Streptomyces sp. NPDC017991]|uniref:hypothetical protein n=1 Tax=Streptomyces sp. NPDC017991 TaxID=3365026 RepID=UPI00378C9FDF